MGKKTILFFIGILMMLLPSTVLAAWSHSVSISSKEYRDGSILYTVNITSVSDGTDPDEISISDYMAATSPFSYTFLKDGLIYDIINVAIVTPDNTWTLAIDDGDGEDIIDLTGLSVSTTDSEHHSGDTDRPQYPMINNPDLQIDYGDIGSNLDSVNVKIKVLK